MDRFDALIEQAEQQCRLRGTRLTIKRRFVLLGLLRSEKALSAYELIDVCEKAFGETLPAMSIYRILDFLEGEHLVHKLNLANKYIACAHIDCDRKHEVSQFLICSKCQAVKEIIIGKSTMADLKQNVEHAGYQLVSPQLEMHCICENCKANVA